MYFRISHYTTAPNLEGKWNIEETTLNSQRWFNYYIWIHGLYIKNLEPQSQWITCDLRASNWGLTRVTKVASSFITFITAGITYSWISKASKFCGLNHSSSKLLNKRKFTLRIEMNERSSVTTSTFWGSHGRYLRFVRSITVTLLSLRILSATCHNTPILN